MQCDYFLWLDELIRAMIEVDHKKYLPSTVDSQQAADGSVQLKAMGLQIAKLQEQVVDLKNIVLGFVFVMFVFLILKY